MPKWLKESVIIQIHHAQAVEHGGLRSPADRGKFDSNLYRPINLLEHEPETTIFRLAACYGYGFARNHVFPDGNKRVSLASIGVFLHINGLVLTATEVEAVHTINAVAAGEFGEEDLANWIDRKSDPKVER